MVKDVQIYLYGLKKTCLGVLDSGDRDKYNETGLKEEGGIEMSTTVLSIYAMHALFRFEYLQIDLRIMAENLSRKVPLLNSNNGAGQHMVTRRSLLEEANRASSGPTTVVFPAPMTI